MPDRQLLFVPTSSCLRSVRRKNATSCYALWEIGDQFTTASCLAGPVAFSLLCLFVYGVCCGLRCLRSSWSLVRAQRNFAWAAMRTGDQAVLRCYYVVQCVEERG